MSSILNWIENSIATGAAAAILLAGAATFEPAEAAKIEIKEAKVDLDENGAGTPFINVKYYQNISDWDATGLSAIFDLQVYLKLNVGSWIVNYSINVPNSPFHIQSALPGSGTHIRVARSRPPVGKYASSRLGQTTRHAISLCRSASPNGAKVAAPIRFDMPVKLNVVAKRVSTDFRHLVVDRKIPVFVRCQGLSGKRTGTAPSGPNRKKRFAVTGGILKVTKFGKQCPRLIATRVTLQANKEGKAKYVLRRSDGTNFKRTMLVRHKQGQIYKASFDHQFKVRKSKTIRLWVEHKGRKLTKAKTVRVNCKKSYEPGGVYIE